jgi:dihydrofolate synthase/folylpolyglutamate synthase
MGTPASGPYPIEVLGASIQVDSPLSGAHQHRNLALAIAAAVELATTHNYPIVPAAIAEGLRRTQWPARLERISCGGVEWILDVAHNPAGAWALRAGLSGAGLPNAPRTLIFSCLRDKPIAEMAQILFPVFDRVILVPLHAARAAALDDLTAAAKATGSTFTTADSAAEALALASSQNDSGLIVVSGSVYLVGEARTLLLANSKRKRESAAPDTLETPAGRPLS